MARSRLPISMAEIFEMREERKRLHEEIANVRFHLKK